MTKTPISLQDLRRRLYIKAKTEPLWRFWVCMFTFVNGKPSTKPIWQPRLMTEHRVLMV